MSRPRRRAVAVGVLLALTALTSCAPEAGSSAGREGPSESNVQVDTPELRRLKAAAGVEECRPGTAEDGALPPISLPCLGGGERVDLSTLGGPLVINFWAASCGPCRTEMPALQEFYEAHGDQVPVLGIDFLDTVPKGALELVQQTGVTYPLLADPGGELQGTDLRPIALPTFAFLAEDGEVTMVGGGIDSAAELEELVADHLGVDL